MLKQIIVNAHFMIPVYNLMCGIALITGLIYLEMEFERNVINHRFRDKIITSIIITLLFSILGARLFDWFFHRDAYYSILEAGFTFYGGLFTGAFTFLLLLTFFDLPVLGVFNLVTPSLVIGHFWGRIGCFLGGCCYGRPTDFILGVVFPKDSLASLSYGPGVAVHPTQLYEALFLLILFLVLVKLISFSIRTAVYLCSYGSFRFVLEFLRGDDRGTLIKGADLHPAQFISVLCIVIGFIMLVMIKTRRKNQVQSARSQSFGLLFFYKF